MRHQKGPALRLKRVVLRRVHVIAVYDSDKAHQLCRPPITPPYCKRRVAAQLLIGSSPASSLSVVFLERNMETLLEAIRQLKPDLATLEMFDKALRHRGSRAARDIVLKNAAGQDGLRNSLLSQVPSFGYLVQTIINRWPRAAPG